MKLKKLFAVSCAAVLSLSAVAGLAACGSKDTSYTVFIQKDDNPATTLDNNPVMNYWRKQNDNIKFEWISPAGNTAADTITNMSATGDWTNVLDLGLLSQAPSVTLDTLKEAGDVWNLAPYMQEHMPNYWALINKPENGDIKSTLYTSNENGDDELYNIAVIKEKPAPFFGLNYDEVPLQRMTNNNIQYPSGNEQPTTIADMEYMLDLYKKYYDQNNIQGAPFVLPYNGYIATGEFMGAFGIGGSYYMEDGQVKVGIYEDKFYNYLTTMKKWWDKGWIDKDFASRTQDMFYYPAPELTTTGRAGIWTGLEANLGDTLDTDTVDVYVRPMVTPIDEASGVTKPLGILMDISARASNNEGYVITKVTPEEDMIKIIEAFDWFYSEEGSITRTMGLSAAQGAADYKEYTDKGLTNGTRKDGTKEWTTEMDNLTTAKVVDFAANRMPGMVVTYNSRSADKSAGGDWSTLAREAWTYYGSDNVYSLIAMYMNMEKIQTELGKLQQKADGQIVKFITGTTPLNETTFKAYQADIKSNVDSLIAELNTGLQILYSMAG